MGWKCLDCGWDADYLGCSNPHCVKSTEVKEDTKKASREKGMQSIDKLTEYLDIDEPVDEIINKALNKYDDSLLAYNESWDESERIDDETWKKKFDIVVTKTYDGLSSKQICEAYHISTDAIKRIKQSKYFGIKLQRLSEKFLSKVADQNASKHKLTLARQIIMDASVQAANSLVAMAQDGDSSDRLRFEACKDILDRGGVKPIEISETHERSLSPEELKNALSTMKEVETILKRLDGKESKYVIKRTVTGCAPVTYEPVEPTKENNNQSEVSEAS